MHILITDPLGPVTENPEEESNRLFPVFLKLEKLSILIVGGGKVALEKLEAVLANSPRTTIHLVAPEINERICTIAAATPGLRISQKKYDSGDLLYANIVIVAVNDIPVATQIKDDAQQKGLLVNVADTPDLCDFYLGSVVKKGNLKIAISTNGKSPTIAKRLKEVLNETIPDQLDDVLHNMQTIRQQIRGDFSEKVRQLDELTRVLVTTHVAPDEKNPQKPNEEK